MLLLRTIARLGLFDFFTPPNTVVVVIVVVIVELMGGVEMLKCCKKARTTDASDERYDANCNGMM
jgi:hypothetical protein